MRRLFVLASASLVLAGSVQAQERRAMTTDDGLDMVRVGNAMMSPDGEWVFFSKSELDWDENKRNSRYYMVSADGGEAFPFIGKEGGGSFRFSPKGTYVSFTRAVDSKSQLFLMRTAGGEALQLTKHKAAIGAYRWAEDESRIFFSANEARDEEEEKARKKGDDAIFVDEGPNGQTEGQWSNFWSVDVSLATEPVEPTRITEKDDRIGSWDLSDDGARIVYTVRTENRRNQGNHSEIHILDLATKESRQVTDNRAPEGGLQWAPDNRTFAFTAPSDTEWDLRNSKIYVADAETGDARRASADFEGGIRNWWWTPDSRSILFNGVQRTNQNLYRLDVSSGEIEQLTHGVGTRSVQGFSKDRTRAVYTFTDFDTPSDIWSWEMESKDGVRLTHANPAIESEMALGEGEVVRWTSQDGTEIEGLLMLPAGYDRSDPLPLLLHIHGGPAGAFTNGFRSSYHVWAGLGYAQLMPNVRGSSGYSDELLRGNMADIGGGDYQDLMTGVDKLITDGIADPEHLALRGWSYGGILGGWTVTQTDRFKSASVGAMVSDWTSEYGPGFNYDVRLWYIGGTPWENPEEWRQKSALTHVANVTTPTLILHGMNDRTDTEPQSMMFFQALKDQGNATRYIRFPREPHGFREPHHQRIRDVEEIRWIQKYTRGIEWEPWERKKKEEEKPKVVTDQDQSERDG